MKIAERVLTALKAGHLDEATTALEAAKDLPVEELRELDQQVSDFTMHLRFDAPNARSIYEVSAQVHATTARAEVAAEKMGWVVTEPAKRPYRDVPFSALRRGDAVMFIRDGGRDHHEFGVIGRLEASSFLFNHAVGGQTIYPDTEATGGLFRRFDRPSDLWSAYFAHLAPKPGAPIGVGLAGDRQIIGTLIAVHDDRIELDVLAAGPQTFRFDDVIPPTNVFRDMSGAYNRHLFEHSRQPVALELEGRGRVQGVLERITVGAGGFLRTATGEKIEFTPDEIRAILPIAT